MYIRCSTVLLLWSEYVLDIILVTTECSGISLKKGRGWFLSQGMNFFVNLNILKSF
jgi:hypothetical protein